MRGSSRTRQVYHLLKSMFDDAVKDNWLPRNMADGVDLQRPRTVYRRYLTQGRVAELAEAAGAYRS
jgi:hypothetical protein